MNKTNLHSATTYLQAKLDGALELIPGGSHVPKEFWDQTRRNMALMFFDRHIKTSH